MQRTIVTLGLLKLLTIPVEVAAQNPPALCNELLQVGGCVVEMRDIKYRPAYQPASATVPVGTTIMWLNHGQQPHTVEAYSYNWSVSSGPIPVGGFYSFSFTEPGYFEYACAFHPEMRGDVIVTG